MVQRAPQMNEASSQVNLRQLAGDALSNMRGLTAEEQSQAGAFVLAQARDLGDSRTREMAERALEVMEKFPHFPRPRAAVVMRALESLAKS